MGQLFSGTSKNEDNADLVSSFNAYFEDSETELNIISQETMQLIVLQVRKGNILGVNSLIADALEKIDNAPINIAVTGESGAGKSSFINALRGIGPEDEGAAKVGVVETTMKRTPYQHPTIKTLTLWDLPGIGTQKYPPNTYLEQVKFKEYDFFIILSATRFTKLELDLAKAIRSMDKNYYFVRTKVDLDLQNEEVSKPHTFDRGNILKEIRSYSVKQFRENNMDVPQIFLISVFHLSHYDFSVLLETLIKDLPSQKRQNFILFLPNITEAVIERKHKATKQLIWLKAFNGVLATFPVEGILRDIDLEKLKESLKQYQKIFGVDDESLEIMAKDFQVPVEQMKEIIKSPHLLKTNREKTLGEKLLNCSDKFAYANGGLLATGIYFWKTFYLHLFFLDTVAEDGKTLLQWTRSKNYSTYPQVLIVTT